MSEGEVIKLHLESIASGGEAVGRYNGKTVFAEGGAPDEAVICRIKAEHSAWIRAELLEITSPSSVRTESLCRYYGRCGGCNLQHIDYNAQIQIKVEILKESFLRIGAIKSPEPAVFPSRPWEYRNRMQFHCLRQTAGGIFGLKGRGSGEIIVIDDCLVAASGIRKILGSDPKTKPLSIPPEKDRFTVFSKDNVLLNEGGITRGKISVLNKEITADAGVFFQSNCYMLEKLVCELIKTAETADRNLPIADLYCGVGTFAAFLGELFPLSVLAEVNKTAVSIARENVRGMNAEFFALRDTDWHKSIFNKNYDFGFAVIDPPRSGISSALAQTLARKGPPVLAYVSCDTSSLARDSKILINGNYKLDKLMLFDFYPQTAHIESLAVFTR